MKKSKLVYILQIPLFSAIICIMSMIAIPTPVPFTLQLLGIFVALMTLGDIRGILATILYIAIGLVLPVFSGFGVGIGHILGVSGGYIIGFIPLGFCYLVCSRLFGGGTKRRILYAAASLVPLYACGVIWQCLFFTEGSFEGALSAIATFVLPFIIPDIVKIFLAAIISKKLSRVAR